MTQLIMKLQNQNREKKKIDDFIRYSSLGFEMAAIIILGAFGGYKIDQWLKNDFKIFTFIFLPVFVILSIFYGVRKLLKK